MQYVRTWDYTLWSAERQEADSTTWVYEIGVDRALHEKGPVESNSCIA